MAKPKSMLDAANLRTDDQYPANTARKLSRRTPCPAKKRDIPSKHRLSSSAHEAMQHSVHCQPCRTLTSQCQLARAPSACRERLIPHMVGGLRHATTAACPRRLHFCRFTPLARGCHSAASISHAHDGTYANQLRSGHQHGWTRVRDAMHVCYSHARSAMAECIPC